MAASRRDGSRGGLWSVRRPASVDAGAGARQRGRGWPARLRVEAQEARRDGLAAAPEAGAALSFARPPRADRARRGQTQDAARRADRGGFLPGADFARRGRTRPDLADAILAARAC